MATFSEWVAGARPRTLPMAVAPVLIGASAAFSQPVTYGWFAYAPLTETTHSPGAENFVAQLFTAVFALVVALALQVGVNYANDYSDGVRGTDDARVGPMRLTASGAAQPSQVKMAAFLSFGAAGLAGLIIVILSGLWWMLAVGAVCVVAAWWYTGGPKPYGYMGLGEVMVFVFFGLVATLGTTYSVLATGTSPGSGIDFPHEVWVGAVAHGLIASALLMANNIRDIPTDKVSGKITLAVRLGDRRARWSYVLMLGLAVILPLVLLGISPWYLLVLLVWPLCLGPIRIVLSPTHTGPALIKVLQLTGIIGLGFALTFSAALILS